MSTPDISPDRSEKEIFFAALEKTSAEARAAFLDGACGRNPVLRARVEQLLAAHLEGDEFMKTAAAESIPTVVTPILPVEQLGATIGRYKLLEKLGEGGFGTVWLAEQKEPVRRKVALKIIKLGMDTRQVVARFEAERQALALMDHPNIAKVLDAGATDTGRPYFVMELVRGVKITDYCDQNHLTTQQRLDLFIKVCQAIQHAHQKGIIHRDIKPSNILVTLHDGVPVPKVIDFGIAKATQGELTDKTIHTQFQQFIGTPAYMSPEQAEMSGLDIDTRSDIYSLGVLLYELLTGQTPFDVRELLSQGLDAMRRTIREQEPARPSTRLATLQGEELTTTAKRRAVEAAKLTSLVRGDLDWIVMKCLEKDRARRYETANGVAADLQRHLNDEPVLARPPSRIYEFQRTVRRHKAGFAATAAVILALSIGMVLSAWQAVRARQAEKLATERLAEVARERDAKELARQRAEAITGFLREVFHSPDPSRDGRTITVAETLDKAATRLETDLATQPERRAELKATLAQTYAALGLNYQAIPLQVEVRDYYLGTLGPEHPDTLDALNNLANCYLAVGRWEEALRTREEVLALRHKVNGPEHPDTLDAMDSLVVSYAAAGRRQEALKLQEEAVTLHRKVNGPEHPSTFIGLGNLANLYREVGRLDEALQLHQKVLLLTRKAAGPEHPTTLNAMDDLAASYATIGHLDDAHKLHQEALALSRKVRGPEHPGTLRLMNNVAVSCLDAGRLDEAIGLLEEALALSRKVNGPEHPLTLWIMRTLALGYTQAARAEKALKLQEEVLVMTEKTAGPEHPDTLSAMGDLAISYATTSHLNKAINLQERILAARHKVLGPEDPETLNAKGNLALSYWKSGRLDEALKMQEEVLVLVRKVLGPEHPDTLNAVHNLALSCFDAGRRGEALKMREDVLALRRKVLRPGHPDTLKAMSNLAASYEDAGRRGDSLQLREEVLAINRKVLGPKHPVVVSSLNDLAWFLATCDDAELRNGPKAVKLAEEAVAATARQDPNYLDSLAAAYARNAAFRQGRGRATGGRRPVSS